MFSASKLFDRINTKVKQKEQLEFNLGEFCLFFQVGFRVLIKRI
jgi:hypothetical protein